MLEVKTIGELMADMDEEAARDPQRYPIRNSEPRTQMGGHKWHLIMERDHKKCWMCGTTEGPFEVDHVVPRSSFEKFDLAIADRSDNLRVACLPCNQAKSNFDKPRPHNPTIGVTAACWKCLREPEPESSSSSLPAYCGRCGNTRVPDDSWLL